jgi:hypothetical protein
MDHVIGGAPPQAEFEPEECYFQIRLSEMFLKNQRHYWQGFIPITIASVDFLHDGGVRCVPVYIGNIQLKAIQAPVQNEYVEYTNTNILGPYPYIGGEIGFFIGLFRTRVIDLSRQLFDFIEKIIKVFDVTQLSSYLKIADAIGSGLSELLEMKEHVQLQMGRRHVFTDRHGDPSRLRPGYLIYVNCPETELNPRHLWVKNGLLYFGEDPARLRPFQSHDFCLIEMIRRERRNDYTAMPFHRTYKCAQKEIFKGNTIEADRLFLSLIQQIASSPDLTRHHRFYLIQAYSGNFEKQVELYRQATGKISAAGAATRGPREGLNARDVLKKAARSAATRGFPPHVERALLDVSKHLNEFKGIGKPMADLTDDDLNNQLKMLVSINRFKEKDPVAILNALSLIMLKTN